MFVRLRDQNHNDIELKSFSYSLYGSSFAPDTLLQLRPGEWVTAQLKFKIESKYLPEPGEFPKKSLLFAEMASGQQRMGSQGLPGNGWILSI
jgi:hypothetical protein